MHTCVKVKKFLKKTPHALNSHKGLLSTQEALYHKVPLVGVPISNDQKPNMMRAEANGYAIMLDLQTITKGTINKFTLIITG